MSRKPVPKNQKKIFIQVGLPKELHDIVVAMAANDDRSISNIGLMLIREAVEAREGVNPKWTNTSNNNDISSHADKTVEPAPILEEAIPNPPVIKGPKPVVPTAPLSTNLVLTKKGEDNE